MVVNRNHGGSAGKIAYGVLTADCVPIIGSTKDKFFLIHAGWRGLANGIIEETVKILGNATEIETILIGPCAGGDLYEVGLEVIDQIGSSAVFKTKQEKLFLDLEATAMAQLKQLFKGAVIEGTGLCTIKEEDFHSFRRDGSGRGTNLAWVIP